LKSKFLSLGLDYKILPEPLGNISLLVKNSFDIVIISASRRAEKLKEAPSAVSIIIVKQVTESGGSISPLRAVMNTPGDLNFPQKKVRSGVSYQSEKNMWKSF